jgi:hypothetical protein
MILFVKMVNNYIKSKKYNVEKKEKKEVPSRDYVINGNGNGKSLWERVHELNRLQNENLLNKYLFKAHKNFGLVINDLVSVGMISLYGRWSVYRSINLGKYSGNKEGDRVDLHYNQEYYPFDSHDAAIEYAKFIKGLHSKSKKKVYVLDRINKTELFEF